MSKLTYHILIISGFALIAIAVTLYGYGLIDDFFTGRRARNLFEQIGIEAGENLPTVPSLTDDLDNEGYIDGADLALFPAEVTSVSFNGLEFNIIGFVSIPKLKITLPIIDRCTDELLKISVCWYGGEMKPGPVRMILTAHNYRTHFGHINRLVPGDEVIFQTINGVIYNYRVTELTEIAEDDQEGLSSGEWDLTLLTCTKDRVRRILVRCVLD
ncbi:MAG: sortase [Lachnospiraceae bacterium]|nr:sortase [Lachnospiraceae bacterium]